MPHGPYQVGQVLDLRVEIDGEICIEQSTGVHNNESQSAPLLGILTSAVAGPTTHKKQGNVNHSKPMLIREQL